ncbi:MAG: hypothetical protein H6626_09505 [Pseudobdellovibrionaceae bacterium]|nr:hypothetical protein [Bdellovibrionales bacterium]USN46451.1 MAG: hypothetical protein H6626_09505 [Pseudobdellovibrionaceae bacterium]
MEQIIDLLEEKNRFLEKFYRLNESEILKFADGNFDGLELFYGERESILEIIGKLDGRIEESSSAPVDPKFVSNVAKKQILSNIDYKNEVVSRILEQDLQILSFIEQAKSNIIRELSQVRAAKKAIGSYKSGEVNRHLDEEV